MKSVKSNFKMGSCISCISCVSSDTREKNVTTFEAIFVIEKKLRNSFLFSRYRCYGFIGGETWYFCLKKIEVGEHPIIVHG